MGDKEIIEMLFARFEESLAVLDGKYGKSLRKIALNIVGNEQDAEECVNDAYLAVWNRIPPDKPSPLAAFIFKILRNISMKKYRAAHTQKRNCVFEDILSELEPFLSADDTVESEIEKKELALAVQGFLDTLSRDERTLFMRRYWFSESYAEISRDTGIGEKYLSVKIGRTKEKMRKYLKERGVLV
jgi:RNA polymerase sigma-70 factor (ECF subfamily)